MRRVVSSAMLACGLLAVSSGFVGVSLIPAPAPAAAAGKKVCTIGDERLVEISGLVATENGYVVINDSSEFDSRKRVFLLDRKCKVTKAVPYGGNGPRDPEDLAISPDGKTLWVADTGDNITSSERRSSVVLWSLPVTGASRPVLHRLTYPKGKAQDAEALLIGDDGTPYIITKSLGKAEIYRPTAALRKNNDDGVPMEKAGEISLPATTTANRFGPPGRVTITGAGRSPDGKRVVLRTYADAFEWDVADGDLVKALTSGKPRVTALADPFGEAIAYTPDGTRFLTVSDVGSLGDEATVEILSYVPAKETAVKAGAAGGAETEKGETRSWLDKLTLDQITYLIAAVGVLGVLLVGAGVLGIVLSRRRAAQRGPESAGSAEETEPDAGREPVAARAAPAGFAPVGAAAPPGPARGTTYGGGAGAEPPAPPRAGGGYRAPGGGAVYGGGRPGGGVYGGPAAGGGYDGNGYDGGGYDGNGYDDGGGYEGGGYSGGPGAGGGGAYRGGNAPYGGYRPDDDPRAGRSPRGYGGGPAGPPGRGAPVEPRHPDNDYRYR